jgi:hypothetical protein
MNARRTLVGLSLLCALIISALSASSALAVESGTTAFECSKSTTTKTFSDEHCTNSTTGTKEWGHKAIAAGTSFSIVGSNAKTNSTTTAAEPAVLLGTIAGIAVELKCTTVSSTGSLKNVLTGEVHSISGTGIVITYTGCTVVKPVNGCSVKNGTITTNSLTAASKEMGIVFSPPTSGIFTEITLQGCTTSALNGTFPVKGSATAEPVGATLKTTDAGTTGTLTFAGQKAGLTQVETIRKPEGNPIATTTPPFLAD